MLYHLFLLTPNFADSESESDPRFVVLELLFYAFIVKLFIGDGRNSIEVMRVADTASATLGVYDESVRSQTSTPPSVRAMKSMPGLVGDHLPAVRYVDAAGLEKIGTL